MPIRREYRAVGSCSLSKQLHGFTMSVLLLKFTDSTIFPEGEKLIYVPCILLQA